MLYHPTLIDGPAPCYPVDNVLPFAVGKPPQDPTPTSTPASAPPPSPATAFPPDDFAATSDDLGNHKISDELLQSESSVDSATPRELLEFEQRVEAWRESYRLELEAGGFDPEHSDREFVYRQVIWQTLQIERAQKRQVELIEAARQRARRTWDQDRELKAQEIGETISRKPALATSRLRGFLQGVTWMIERWEWLKIIIQETGTFTSDQSRKMYDLLGKPLDERRPFAEGVPAQHALKTVDQALDILKNVYLPRVEELDRQDRRRAIEGTSVELSREQRENKRDHAKAMRLYNLFRKELFQPSSSKPAQTSSDQNTSFYQTRLATVPASPSFEESGSASTGDDRADVNAAGLDDLYDDGDDVEIAIAKADARQFAEMLRRDRMAALQNQSSAQTQVPLRNEADGGLGKVNPNTPASPTIRLV